MYSLPAPKLCITISHRCKSQRAIKDEAPMNTNTSTRGLDNIKPNVYDYLDVFHFLKDYYSYRKKIADQFSYRLWALELGISNHSLLRLIVTKKRSLTDSISDQLSNQLFEDEKQKQFFVHLATYSQTRSKEKKKFAGKQLTQMLKSEVQFNKLESQGALFNQALTLRIYSLLDNENIRRDKKTLAFLFSVPESHIEQSLKDLQDLKLVQENDGQYFSAPGAFKLKDNFKNASLRKYYEELFDESKSAIDLAQDQRRFRASMALLTPEEFKEFNQKIDELVRHYQYLGLSSLDCKKKQLYQLNLAIYTTTKRLEEAEI